MSSLLLSGSALGATLSIQPYNGAKFVPGQKFDIRVEAEGVKDFRDATVTLDGQPVAGWTTSKSKENSMEWTLRDQHIGEGSHTLAVTYNDGSGQVIKQATWTASPVNKVPRAKNVILFIGDGMAWTTLHAADMVAHPYNPANGMRTGTLSILDNPSAVGMVTTSSYDSSLADSANTASSIATGQKIQVNALNVYPDNTADTLDNPRVETITEIIRRSTGKRIGVLTDVFGTDATPAAYLAHTRRRGDYQAIADQYFNGSVKPDVLMTGGSRDFIPASTPGSRRKDETNWIERSQQMGYQFVSNRTELLNANGDKLFGLFHHNNTPSYLDRVQYREANAEEFKSYPDLPYLWDTTRKAVETLEKGDDGFFLMVESGNIDKFEHPLDWERAIWNVLELDKAVAWAKDYAKTHPDTLVLVTADHAHSLSVYGTYDATQGPGKREAVGIYEKAGFPTYGDRVDENGIPMVRTDRTLAVGFVATPDYCERYMSGPVYMDPTISNGKTGAETAYVPNPETCKDGFVRAGTLPVSDSQGVHSADPIPLLAFGPGSEYFRGLMDQTDIFFALNRAMALDATKGEDTSK